MSLFKPVDTQTPNPGDVQFEHQAEPANSEWYLKEGIPGEGPRPDWLLPKYTTMEAQAQAYPELMKIPRNDSSAPETYQLDSVADVFDPESAYIASLTAKAKGHKLSQSAFGDMIEEFAAYQKSLKPDTDEEMKKLGENPQRRLDTVNTWASNNLTPKSIDTFGKIAYTADVIELMDEVRQKMHGLASRVPIGQNVEPVKMESPAAIHAEREANYARYKTDAGYRASLTDRLKQALGED